MLAAENLFAHAVKCWDTDGGGGILYTFGPDGEVCDDNKYMWPHPEAFTAALLLHKATGSEHYMDFYRTCWQYSWDHLADSEYGGWYGVLDRQNQKVSNPDYGAGDVKAWFSDYHSMGGVYECMRSIPILYILCVSYYSTTVQYSVSTTTCTVLLVYY